jgi:hypothetical protein
VDGEWELRWVDGREQLAPFLAVLGIPAVLV